MQLHANINGQKSAKTGAVRFFCNGSQAVGGNKSQVFGFACCKTQQACRPLQNATKVIFIAKRNKHFHPVAKRNKTCHCKTQQENCQILPQMWRKEQIPLKKPVFSCIIASAMLCGAGRGGRRWLENDNGGTNVPVARMFVTNRLRLLQSRYTFAKRLDDFVGQML